MGKKRKNPYIRLTKGTDTKFKGIIKVNKTYYIYSDVLPLREAYAWTENKVKELNQNFVKAYVQSWDETKS